MTSKLRLLIFICTTIFLVSCTKKDEHKTINMVCTGKTTFVQEYSNGRYTKRDTEFREVVKVIYDIVDIENNKNQMDWVLYLGKDKYQTKSYKNQKNEENLSSILQVHDELVSYSSSYSKDFDVIQNSSERDSKFESKKSISINRMSGVININNDTKTTWVKGGWVENRIESIGNCLKGEQKF
jgi:hypothetical protein